MKATLCGSLAAAILSLSALTGVAHAQNYPVKPVRWFVPFPPGGGTDVISRAIAAKLSETWGQQVVVDNRPGSGGTIGLAIAAKAPADGYHLVMGQLANVAIAPALYPKLQYDPVKDFTPVTLALASPLILVVHPSRPAKNVKELVALARAQPEAITYGSPGNGTTGHLAMEIIRSNAKVKMVHVPYRGAAPAFTGLLGGEVAVYMSSIQPAMPMLKAGRVRALGVTSTKRIATLPNVPTLAETGLPGYDVTNWYGVMAPAGIPRDVLGKLHADLVTVLRQPEVQQRFAAEGGDATPNTPEQFATFIRGEIAKWGRAVKESGAKVD
jgi:tripartite-type tricarboxylate transporter receptor subunit TctC